MQDGNSFEAHPVGSMRNGYPFYSCNGGFTLQRTSSGSFLSIMKKARGCKSSLEPLLKYPNDMTIAAVRPFARWHDLTTTAPREVCCPRKDQLPLWLPSGQ